MNPNRLQKLSRAALYLYHRGMTNKSFSVYPLAALLLFCTVARANQYTIEVQADRNLKVRGVETISWQNNTGHPAKEIPLICSCRLKRATLQGKPLRIRNNRVLLLEPVEADAGISIKLEFGESAKKAYGYRMLTGAWHPKAVTFRNGQYNINQKQADDYEVTLSAPAALIVAAAGELIDKISTPDGQQRWHWRLQNVTSFGLAASPNFVETYRNAEDVKVRLFQLRGDSRFNPVMADYAVDIIAFYKKLFGFYPQPAAILLPGDYGYGGGYAPASGIMVFHKSSGDYYLRWIVAHEIGHQYWGFDTVIDDGDFNHWPGLPLGIYSDQRYMALHGGGRFGTYQYREAAAKGLDTTIRKTSKEMKKLKFDWNNIICHSKAFGVIRMLEDLMGKDHFLKLIQILLERFRYQYLSFEDFQAVAEEEADRQLDWFFHDWVNTNSVASYVIEDVQRREKGISVKIRRMGTARFPIEIGVMMDDGSHIMQRIAHEPEVQFLDFEISGVPKLVEIDPRKICPTIDQGKRIWELQSKK